MRTVPNRMWFKEALELYFQEKRNQPSPYQLGEDLFGAEGNGVAEDSATYKKQLKRQWNEKHSH